MKITDREKIYGKEACSGFIWCLHCGRTYKNGQYKEETLEMPKGIFGNLTEKVTFQMCPYPDCDGDTVLDGFNWSEVRLENKDFPKTPRRGVVYRD